MLAEAAPPLGVAQGVNNTFRNAILTVYTILLRGHPKNWFVPEKSCCLVLVLAGTTYLDEDIRFTGPVFACIGGNVYRVPGRDFLEFICRRKDIACVTRPGFGGSNS